MATWLRTDDGKVRLRFSAGCRPRRDYPLPPPRPPFRLSGRRGARGLTGFAPAGGLRDFRHAHHRSGRRRRRRPVPARPARPRPRTPTSPSSATPATTSPCSACTSAPTSTPSCTPWAAASARSRAGAGPTRPSPSCPSWPPTAPGRTGSASATGTSPRTSLARPMLNAGATLSAVTSKLCERWQPGVTLLPMSDDRIETHVTVDEDGPDGPRTVHFQEWWVRLHAAVPARQIVAAGAAEAAPAPGVLAAIEAADFVLLPPSNPVVSIGDDPGRAAASPRPWRPRPSSGCRRSSADAPVHGMADACLTAIGVADHGRRGRRALRAGPARRLAGRRAGQGRRRRARSSAASRCAPCRST